MDTQPSAKQKVAGIFNSHIAAGAIGAAWEVGLLDEILHQREVSVDTFASQKDLDRLSLQGLVSALCSVGVVRRSGDCIVPDALFSEVYTTKGLFHWLALGSGSLFARMQHALRNENRTGAYYSRDSAAIALACRDANTQFFDDAFLKALASVPHSFHSVVDLGSGSGERLMQILDLYDGSVGLGVDIAGPAIAVAEERCMRQGYGDRISFMEGDVLQLKPCERFSNVDLLTSFLMGHDFWPRENCIASLQNLRKAFPKVQRFFLCDTMRILTGKPDTRHQVEEDDIPIFTLGFEFGHALMGATLPTLEDWEGVFEDGGWECTRQHHLMPPSLSVIFELQPLAAATAD